MGEGKSSVIVPIVAVDRAHGSCLVRVLVGKPQSRQMLQMLVSKLGGLLGRRIYHLPISRSLSIDVAEANEIERMCRECMEQGGILLLQPEHILSLKLMCFEPFIIGRSEIGESILKTPEFFKKSSRDIVDESDENFSVKFELIYTMGTQQSLELSPQRWIIIQEVLDLFRKYTVEIKGTLLASLKWFTTGRGASLESGYSMILRLKRFSIKLHNMFAKMHGIDTSLTANGSIKETDDGIHPKTKSCGS